MWIVEDIERVLFQKNLLVGAEIAGKNKIWLVWNGKQASRAGLGNQLGAGSALYAMRRPLLKFGVIGSVRIG